METLRTASHAYCAAFDRVKDVVSQVECPPYEFYLTEEFDQIFIQARLWRTDVDNGEVGYGYSAPYLIDDGLSTDAIVRRCFAACLAYAEHETRESFKWKGRRVLGPHVSLEKLWEACGE